MFALEGVLLPSLRHLPPQSRMAQGMQVLVGAKGGDAYCLLPGAQRVVHYSIQRCKLPSHEVVNQGNLNKRDAWERSCQGGSALGRIVANKNTRLFMHLARGDRNESLKRPSEENLLGDSNFPDPERQKWMRPVALQSFCRRRASSE